MTGAPHPILNDVITMASTPDDLVSFFSRALQGEFFRFPETLAVFRAILSTADAIAATMPLGVSAFGKGGSFALNQEYALSFAGGMYVPDRWVYFSLIINWTAAEAGSAHRGSGAVRGRRSHHLHPGARPARRVVPC